MAKPEGEASMDGDKINMIFEQILKEAQELKIPVPANINGQITINPRPKKRYGCCKFKDGTFHIEISAFLLTADEKKIREVIAHEILHSCKGCQNHGAKWKEYAEKMNTRYGYQIKRISSFQEMGLDAVQEKSVRDTQDKIKYIIKCQKCGMEYPRQKFTCVMKKINAYRCQCGGKLFVIRK